MDKEALKTEILRLTREYSKLAHKNNRPGIDPDHAPFIPGQSGVPYAARVFTEDEVEAAVSATLDFWLTLGPEGDAFQKELAEVLGVKYSLLVNSGSSANLIAFACLTSAKLPENKRICPGDEVITVAAGFPTTVAPIVQLGAVPVFIDAIPQTGNADITQLEAAFTPGKTKAVMMAHALGNPFDLAVVLEFCQRHDLWLIEDNCDALGCTYTLPLAQAKSLGLIHLIEQAEAQLNDNQENTHLPAIHKGYNAQTGAEELFLTAFTGSFGDLSTQSFYPPHHLTLGEGGAVNIVRRAQLKSIAESFRDWGRDCWCPSGKDNTCCRRFKWKLGELPEGYDHKYIYSHLGYNLKPLDPQAAIGRVQLRRLFEFVEARKFNWQYLRKGLANLEAYFDFALPTGALAWHENGSFTWKDGHDESMFSFPEIKGLPLTLPKASQSSASWFGFKMTVKADAPFTRTELTAYLDEAKIGNRMLFGGNLVRQPAFVQLHKDNELALKTPVSLNGADRIMNYTLFIGTYPGLTIQMLDYIIQIIHEFVASKIKN